MTTDSGPTSSHDPALDSVLSELDEGATTSKETKVSPAATAEPTPTRAAEAAPATTPPSGLMAKVHRGKRLGPQRILVYGPPGIGKSTFGAAADNSIFIPTEDGLRNIDCASLPLCKSLDEVLGHFRDLSQDQHDFSTVVLDSLDWLERLVWAEVCKEHKVGSIEEIGYAKGYQFALTHWRKVMACLDWLREERGMQVIVIAHARIEKFSDPTGDTYDRHVPKLHKDAGALWIEWADNIFCAHLKTLTRSTDKGFNKTETKALTTGDRLLRTRPHPAYIAKNRLNLPEEIPLDYRVFSHLAYGTPLPQAAA